MGLQFAVEQTKPPSQLMGLLNGNTLILSSLTNVQEL